MLRRMLSRRTQAVLRRSIQKIRGRAQMTLAAIYHNRGFVFRCLLCWGIGCLILVSDEVTSYDTRLQVRGDQVASSDIVIIMLRKADIPRLTQRRYVISELDLSESAFWDEAIWSKLFQFLLLQNARAIAVTMHFPQSQVRKSSNDFFNKVFFHPKIFWAVAGSAGERPELPAFANFKTSNVGSSEMLRDEDGIVRRFYSPSSELPHLAERVTDSYLPMGWMPRFINFRGSQKVFSHYLATDVLAGRVHGAAFRNKIVFIGAEGLATTQVMTPLGGFQRADLMAQIADNLLENRWIHRAPNVGYALLLFAIMALSVFILTQYPQSVALMFLLWLDLLIGALSIWVFDSRYFWLPIASPVLMVGVVWIIFVGYQANKMERRSWQLQQEQRSLRELEHIKNNFVSLISHDLKTPIAKIQSIVDRLTRRASDTESQTDLKSIRTSSEELNRYIESILKVLRVESRDFKLHREVCDLNELIEDALGQLRPLAVEKGIVIHTILEPLFSMEADTTLIREVLVNLIENAIKYTPSQGTIWVRSKENDRHVTVEVQDTGEGIAAEEVDSVWKKFVRGRDQDLKTKGSGLGLYLVKYFIELHGGTVSLESEIKMGTKVSFSLPLET